MSKQQNVVFFNGELKLEREVGIPIRDRGYIYGDAVFDATRTFGGKPFRLREHIRRLYQSLRYVRIDPHMDPTEMERWSLEVVNHNYPLLPPGQDMWVMQRISRGVEATEPGEDSGPTVLIESHAIPFARRATLYRDGAGVITPPTPRIPPRFVSPRAKTHNYLNLVLGELEAQGTGPNSWAVLLDESGNLTEGRGSNIFLIQDGVVATPRGQFVLEGITRGAVMDLAAGLGLSVEERDLDLYDAYTADEAFLTSTSLCICPVSSVNGASIGDGRVPGPVTRRLMSAFSDLAGMDYEAQYLSHLP
ncbi:MAG: aminotransferase class IV [Dehalococcoidia bacterium]|nr:aminotransferase class IV [Dehalococcoidia bacterium]